VLTLKHIERDGSYGTYDTYTNMLHFYYRREQEYALVAIMMHPSSAGPDLRRHYEVEQQDDKHS
jgi:hypothetical protein